jgi:hypothetical protein
MDGYMSFQEYAQQMALQVQQAGQKLNNATAQGMEDLQKETKKAADSFNDLPVQ